MRKTLENELTNALNETTNMLKIVDQMLPLATEALINGRTDLVEEIKELDVKIDDLEHEIEAECLKIIALHQPVARDLRMVGVILKSLADIERMGDYVVHIARAGVELKDSPLLKKYSNLKRMLDHLCTMNTQLSRALNAQDVQEAELILEMDNEIDDLYDQMQRELITYMLEDPQFISKSLLLMKVGRSLERVGDHMENVAERVRYWVTGERFHEHQLSEKENPAAVVTEASK